MRTKSLICMGLLLLAGAANAALTGLWQFDGNLNAASGSALTFRGNAGTLSTFNTTSGFGIPTIDGVDAQVMKFQLYRNTDGLQVNANLAANGGGSKVNIYTLAMDILPTAAENQFYSVFETTLANNDSDAEYFINDTDSNYLTRDQFGAGTPLGGYMKGNYIPGQWYRLVIVVDCQHLTVKTYINGEFVGALNNGSLGSTTVGVGGVDGRFSLTPGVTNLLMWVNPSNNWAGTGYINSLAVYNTALTPTEVKELGAASATGIPAAFPSLPAAPTRVITTSFNKAPGTDPIAAGDVSNIWAVGAEFHGIFGWYDYDGVGNLILDHPNVHYADPWFEIATTSTLALTDSFDSVLTFTPHFTNTTPNDQSIVLQLTDQATSGSQDLNDSFTTADTDVFMKVKNTTSTVNFVIARDPANPGFSQEITTPGNQITTLSLRLRYEAATQLFRGFCSVNNGPYLEYRGGPVALKRTKGTLRVTAETAFGYNAYNEFQIGVNKITVDKGVNGIAAGTIARESTFNSLPPTNGDIFYPLTVGDVDQFFTADGTFAFNGLGQAVFNKPAAVAFANSTINGKYDPANSVSWRLDLKPSFPQGGYGQSLNMLFSSPQAAVVLFNNTGATTVSQRMWGIQFGAANFFSPATSDIQDLSGIPINSVNRLSLLLTYNGATLVHHLYYQINGGAWHEHKHGAAAALHGSTRVEIQYFVTSAANTLPYSVGLDNYQEIQGELPSPILPNAAEHWTLY